MLGVARRTPCLPDFVVDERHHHVIGDASLARTVVIHEIAETQRTLLHSVQYSGRTSFPVR
jgi:hypothetical protein